MRRAGHGGVGFRPSGLRLAPGAKAADHDVLDLKLLPVRNRLRRLHAIEIRPIEILDLVASLTNQVVMIRDINVEAGGVVNVIDFAHQAVLFESGNRSVNRIQRNRPELLPHLLVHVFHRRMIVVLEERPEDLGALMGDSESLVSADRLESGHHLSLVDLAGSHNHVNSLIAQ